MGAKEAVLVPGPRHAEPRGPVRVVVSDVDNTILPNDALYLPASRVTSAFQRASEKVPTGLTTARQPQKTLYLIDHMGLTGKTIMSNGAQIYDGKERIMVLERPMPLGVTMEIARNLQEYGINHAIQDSGVDHRWVPGETPRKDRQTSQGLGTYQRLIDVTHPEKGSELVVGYIPDKPFIIVAQHVSYEDMVGIREMVGGYINQNVTSFIAHENHEPDGSTTFQVFITDTRTNKQEALLTISEMQNIPIEEFMGIGDGPNDKVLVEAAGTGVAMGNAVQETKDVATHIAPSRENDGAAVAIEELVQ